LKKKKEDFDKLNKMGDSFRSRLNSMLQEMSVPLIGTGYGSINFVSHLTSMLEEPIRTPGQLGTLFDHGKQDIFQGHLIQEGVYGYHGLGALSFKHTEEDVEKTLEGISNAVNKMSA
jgi:glutamate-1-semialdehyde aminotransferase